LLQSLTELPNS